MRTLASFVVTVAVVVPTAWHVLEADIETDGRKLRPLLQSFTIGDTKVTLEVDRGLVMTGDSVIAKLVAYSDVPKPITVDLALLRSSNYAGERVEQPLVVIDREKITLNAAPGGGKPFETRLVLGERPALAAQVDDFKVYVTAHGRKPPTSEDLDNRVDYQQDVEAGAAAAVGVMGWSGNNLDISIKPEGPIVAGKPVIVAVRIKNTSGRVLKDRPSVQLATKLTLEGYMELGEDAGITRLDEEYTPKRFRNGEVMVEKFDVVPAKDATRELTFVASATASNDMPGPVVAGAMDARTFPVVADEPTRKVAAK